MTTTPRMIGSVTPVEELVLRYGSTVGEDAVRRLFREEGIPMDALTADEWTDAQIMIGPLARYNLRRLFLLLNAKGIV